MFPIITSKKQKEFEKYCIADTITVLKINQQLNGGDDVVHIYLEGKDQAVMSF